MLKIENFLIAIALSNYKNFTLIIQLVFLCIQQQKEKKKRKIGISLPRKENKSYTDIHVPVNVIINEQEKKIKGVMQTPTLLLALIMEVHFVLRDNLFMWKELQNDELSCS